MRERYTASEEDRLDRSVAGHTKLSRKKARTLIGRGGVRVDGTITTHPAAVVPQGAVVEVRTVSDPRDTPQLPVRYKDRYLMVIDKPAGLPSQGTREGKRVHVYGILSAAERYIGLHHRLDTPASGLLLVTRDPGVNPDIADAFREGTIRRTYLIVVVGDPGPRGEWTNPIDGEAAHTRYKRLNSRDGMSLLAVRLMTGRTHQIRRHAAEAGFPVLGDRRYGGAAGRAWPRLALHAWKLDLYHPLTDAPIAVVAPVPEDLIALVVQAGGIPEDQAAPPTPAVEGEEE